MSEHKVRPEFPCPFCAVRPEQQWLTHAHALAYRDDFPVAEGHTLVLPRQHIRSVFDGSDEQRAALWALVTEVRARLQQELKPDGFVIRVNDGIAAGQTVLHGHIHVIPRWAGDRPTYHAA